MKKTFTQGVLEAIAEVKSGEVTTYGDLARAAGGGRQAARSITGILSRAYKAGQTDIPFHRIVYANGKIWITDAYHKERMKRYKQEGIEVDEKGYIKHFESIRHRF